MNGKKNGEEIEEGNKNENEGQLLGRIGYRKDIVGLEMKNKKHKNKKKKGNKAKQGTDMKGGDGKESEDKGNENNEIVENGNGDKKEDKKDEVEDNSHFKEENEVHEKEMESDVQIKEEFKENSGMNYNDNNKNGNGEEEEEEESFAEDFLREDEDDNEDNKQIEMKKEIQINEEIQNNNCNEIEGEQQKQHLVNSIEYDALLEKYSALEHKYNVVLQEKNNMENMFIKQYQNQLLSNAGMNTNEENVSDLLELANMELSEKNKEVHLLEKQLEMYDLANIKNFSLAKLNTLQEHYSKNLKLIEDAISSFK